MGTKHLSESMHAAITRLCEEGDQLAETNDEQAALEKYNEAWELLPNDKKDWEASTRILAAVGDLYFCRGDHDKALNFFRQALQTSHGFGNPYIHLRTGQLQFEEGNLEEAGDNLTRAYMCAGEEIFNDEDPKYLSCLRTILLPPVRREEPVS